MSLAKVAKVNIIGHQKSKEDFLEVLQSLGFAQIDDYQGELEKSNVTQQAAEIDYQLAGIKFSLEFLTPFDDSKKSLTDRINKISLTVSEVENIVKNFNFADVVEKCQEIESAINQAKNLKDKLTEELLLITPWKNLDFVPDNNQGSFPVKFLSLTDKQKHDLTVRLQKEFPLTELQQAGTAGSGKDKEILATLIYKKNDEEKINEILNNLNIKIVELPSLDKEITARIKEINLEISQADEKIRLQENETKRLTTHIKDLKITFDYLTWQKQKLASQSKTGNTWQTFSLIGWIDEKKIKDLEKAFAKISDDFAIEKLEVTKDEVVPVILKNTWAKDFESITGLYGSPNNSDPDPSPFLAPFFILFFGMAMTDAGYGLIMALGILAVIKFFKIPRNRQKLLRVLMWGGVATFILGALTGGWFSIELATLPGPIGQTLEKIKIIDPVQDPLIIFYLSLGLGVFQVLTGLVISTVWKIKNGDVMDGIFGSGSWFLLILSLLIFAGGSMNLLPSIFGEIGKWLSLTAALMIVYQGTRGTKNVFLKPGLGILGLYGVVGYFSDILSYSRLLALGLTTTIIGTVVNIIAGLVFGLPYVGWLAALIVLVGGHTFNLAINALGAFIHSARLQFIEFFPKFLEAGGEVFEPFDKESKYINLINNN